MSFAHRWSPRLALLLACASLPLTSAAATETGEPAAEEEQRNIALVKIELKQPSGKVLKYDGAMLDWGSEGNITFRYDDHVHDVALTVDRPNDKEKLIKLTVGYTKDGRKVIEPTVVASEIKKREVVNVEGGVAIAITVTAKTVKVDADGEPIAPPPEEPPKAQPPAPPPEQPKEKEQPKKKRIEGPDGDDPLDGIK